MNANEEKRFWKVLTTLGVTFGREVNDALFDVYYEALKDLSIDEIESAAGKLVLTCKHFPFPANIREALFGNIEQRAETAFQICLHNSVYDHSTKFEDPAIAVAIERTAGSWEVWCDWCRWMPDKDFQWKRKEWLKHYAEAVQFATRPSADYFIGYLQEQGALYGQNYGKPTLFIVGQDGGSTPRLIEEWNESQHKQLTEAKEPS